MTTTRTRGTPGAEPDRGAWRIAVCLCVVLGAVYLPIWSAGFVWDDDGHLTPVALRGVDGLARIWTEPRATQQYYPLLHTLFWIEGRLWGSSALGYHVANLALHATAALLLARLLVRLGIPGAWWAASVFALHPLQVESAAWISEQKNTLSACGYFAAWLAWLRFDEGLASGERRWAAWWASLALALAAALSKTVTFTLVPAILLVAWWREGGRGWTRRLAWLAPHFVGASALALLTPWLERHVGGAQGSAYDLSLAERFVVAGKDLWFYLAQLVWPAAPCFVYPRWETGAADWLDVLAPLSFAALLVALFLLRARVGRGPFVAAAFFAGTLFPALGFFDAIPFRYSFVADHFQYLAGLGPIVLACALVAGHAQRIGRGARIALGCAGLALLAALGARSATHARAFHDAETLWRATIERNPGAWMAWDNLIAGLNGAGRFPEALALCERAQQLHAERPGAWINQGVALQGSGRTPEALTSFEHARALDPRSAEAEVNRGSALIELGRHDEALAALGRALELAPELALAHMLRGNALLAQKRSDEAVAAYERALQLAPGHAPSWFNLGVARFGRNELELAEHCFRQALESSTTTAGASGAAGANGARLNLGLVLAKLGRTEAARVELERVVRDAPGSDLEARARQALRGLGGH